MVHTAKHTGKHVAYPIVEKTAHTPWLMRAGAASAVLAMGITPVFAASAFAEEQPVTPPSTTPNTAQQQPTTTTDNTYDMIANGVHTRLIKVNDYKYTGEATIGTRPPATVTFMDKDGKTWATTKDADSQINANGDTPGVITFTGKATYQLPQSTDHPYMVAQLNYTYRAGNEVTANGARFVNRVADAGTVSMNSSNTPATNTVTLSNGQRVNIMWQAPETHSVNGQRVISRNGTGETDITTTSEGITKTVHVTVNLHASRTETWTTHITGHTITFNTDPATGNQSFHYSEIGKHPDSSATVTSSNGTVVSVPLTNDDQHITGTDDLGRARISGTATYHLDANGSQPAFDLTIPYTYVTGTTTTLKDGTKFAHNGDMFNAATKVTLKQDNTPEATTITLSNGQTAPITWDNNVTVKRLNGADYITKNGTATGIVKVVDPVTKQETEQKYTVHVTAQRSQDRSIRGLKVGQAKANGQTNSIDVPNFTPFTHDYTITLPHDAVNDAYTLNPTVGVDSDVSTPTVALGENASRVLTTTINGEKYTVTVKFAPADIQADSPAKLSGIYVNRAGSQSKGSIIDNWNPNRLDYTVTIGEHDPSPYLLPEAGSGVTVKAGDVKQTADGATQSWIVTDKATGKSRTYTVTVVRQRSEKTAPEEFTPKKPQAQEPTVLPDADNDTNLDSHGYVDAQGNYQPLDAADYTVPEGGVFSYKAKKNQSTSVTAEKVKGMTYRYTVSVLSPDIGSFNQHTFTVTYVTPRTHQAVLQNLVVNGQPIKGFSAGKHEYTVTVDNINQWTLVPQYDKLSGMTVTTSKDGANATITVTSADGLVTTVYKVHAVQVRAGLAQYRNTAGGYGVALAPEGSRHLAKTGAGVGVVAAIGVAVAAAAALGFAAKRKLSGKPADAEAGEADGEAQVSEQ